jgi:N-acetylmuramate 1-kinase
MASESDILKLLCESAGIPCKKIRISPLLGDASNRSYSRLFMDGADMPRTLILMELAEPEGFKASEEAVSSHHTEITELPYVNILRHLEGCGTGVPKLYAYDARRGLLLLEDLGDVTLQDHMQSLEVHEWEPLYQAAIDTLIQMRGCAPPTKRSACVAFDRAFDVALYMWEFDHFIEYGIEARSGHGLSASDRDAIRNAFLEISGSLAKEPLGFTHRDYHSRNLMVHDGRLRILDFQDALLGPAVYDLASLLRDSYVEIPEEMIDRCVEYYLRATAAGGGSVPKRDDFRRAFDRMGIQRNLKAAGRFIYIDRVKRKDRYLAYVSPTLGKVRRALERNHDLHSLWALLARHVPELA